VKKCNKKVQHAFLLGSYGSASSAIVSPSPINYFAIRLKAGERWRYKPPMGHTVLWTAVASGTVSVPDEFAVRRPGGFRVVERSGVEFEARTDAEFVLGSAVPHKYDLVLRLPLGPHIACRGTRCPREPFGDPFAPRSRRPSVSTLVRDSKLNVGLAIK